VTTAQIMHAARIHGDGKLVIDEIPVPQPGPGQVLVRVHRCGVCGTDLHIVRGDFPAPNLPLTLGHEFAGVVESVGPDTHPTLAGRRVTADINVACGTCFYCRHGEKLFCPTIEQLGVHRAGGMAEYVVVPAANLYTLPDDMLFSSAAFIEPLACAIHGQNRARVKLADVVLIIGAGPMGMAHTMLARARGVSKVITAEIAPARRAMAAKYADHVIDPSSEHPAERLSELTEGRGPDIVIEAVGAPTTYSLAIDLVRRGGTVLAFGAASPDATIDLKPFDVYSKELDIVGSYAGTYETWPQAIRLIASGRVNPEPLIDSVWDLARAPEAVESLVSNRSAMKVQIAVNWQ
jgi:2-desacetyl-2-hydroxyethyl bacteriochlorophyllide A dehydrogenase